ncbi:STAS-like domain-containing protein [Dolichospermum sp. ST_con]|nr:STAS-like domain-containing protein [Dolichospermum sp. ST_con]MDD1420331.1 STAS-like domain-containing protein [Dolichospermum sp. ST_sed1]MDD1425393.1 STAS-like domain-containing protein [Dolichospermum sp. ST_sed9]MDD1430841.1 STAS-like domain-containing protein [Dolichospermum sp. ST_sed6]MDD1438120.1 STAS-like domain-containing protein [Dolichospermum sp. ST_sed10]MDD1441797.1 STAS-like domain-containing protein [Dolichospermum sp. ST_sed3]MDD1446091.1 STAS-like domain-containing prot
MMYKVYDIVGEYAITPDGGQKLYDQIHPCLLTDKTVELDFAGVKIFASPFVNFAFGQLLKDIPSEKLNQLLEFTFLNEDGWDVINHVMANAKRYYSDDKYRNAVDTVITDMAGSF